MPRTNDEDAAHGLLVMPSALLKSAPSWRLPRRKTSPDANGTNDHELFDNLLWGLLKGAHFVSCFLNSWNIAYY
jgi:hypothetical protein